MPNTFLIAATLTAINASGTAPHFFAQGVPQTATKDQLKTPPPFQYAKD